MTEKRFTLAYEKGNWWAVRDRDITLWKEEVIGLLNELHEENEQLKSNIQDMQTGTYINAKNIIRELKEENEQLKQAYNDAKSDVEKYEQILKDIMKKNMLIQDIEKGLEE